jgi:carboxyl-terminal processing protease
MSRLPSAGVLALSLALLTAFVPFRPVRADDIEESGAAKRVTALLAKDLKDDPRDIWKLSDELKEQGKAAVKPLRAALTGANPARKLAIARALVLLDDHTQAMGVLKGLVEDDKTDTVLSVAALKLVAQEGELDEEEWLASRLESTLEPEVKLAMARGLWQLNRSNKGKGKEVMLQFLRSTDSDLRAQGALALGEIGAGAEAKAVLQELREEPTERGRSAALLLTILHLQQEREQNLRVGPPPGTTVAPPPTGGQWPLLDEIKSVLQRAYVDVAKVADTKRLEDAAAAGLTEVLDPNTQYFPPEVNARFMEMMDHSYGGIGAYVGGEPKIGEPFKISRPIFGGPVDRAGLRAGDIIRAIDGHPTEGLSQEECVRRLKGPAATKVVITVFRRGWTEDKDFALIRARITVPTTAYDVLPGKIGFLQIQGFADETANEVARILDEFDRTGIEGLVVDLRGNTGGWLKGAVDIASQFLPRGTLICTERTRPGVLPSREDRSSGAGDRRRQVPMVVLMNRDTASASEILAGALQVNGRARLVGTMSYGKATMQIPWDLSSRPGEPFTDLENVLPDGRVMAKNSRYDGPERFTDGNGNGRWDAGETFNDANQNRRFDAGEPFQDVNGNGRWDPGAALKLTVGQYLLPDGRFLEHKWKVVDDKVKADGALEPDVEPKAEELDLWELQGLNALEKSGVVKEYVDGLFEKHAAVLPGIARSDRHDPKAYPGFDEFFAKLDTKVSPEAVRFLVRIHVRRRIGDELRRELVGDIVDDLTLQAGLRDLFKSLKKDLSAEPDLAFLAAPATR